jgi:hypothetical protein
MMATTAGQAFGGCTWGQAKNLYSMSQLVTVQTVPYGTDLFRIISLVVNCQATITRSLRDKKLRTLGGMKST